MSRSIRTTNNRRSWPERRRISDQKLRPIVDDLIRNLPKYQNPFDNRTDHLVFTVDPSTGKLTPTVHIGSLVRTNPKLKDFAEAVESFLKDSVLTPQIAKIAKSLQTPVVVKRTQDLVHKDGSLIGTITLPATPIKY